ncbi:MAG: EamA family transporter [Acidobacteriaceae bacterium]
MTRSSKLRDWVLLVLCNLICASQFVLLKIVQVQVGPVAATFFPVAFATLCLVPIVLSERRSRSCHASIQLRDIWQFILIGVLGQVVAQLFVTWGVRFSPASNAALIMLCLPVVTA